jgi:cyclin-A
MESLILKVLSFDVAVPTVHLFCERFLKEVKAEQRLISLAMVRSEHLQSNLLNLYEA